MNCLFFKSMGGGKMLLQIRDGSVSAGSKLVLSHFDFEIRGNEKLAVTGRNGAGKSTLLRLLAGELSLDRDDKRDGPGLKLSRQITVGMLGQQVFEDGERTVEEELLRGCPAGEGFDQERLEYERRYNVMFTGFGFCLEDKKRRLKEFSGGEQTRIGLIGLLLKKPDLLLLDEPTNHLDMEMTEWLEKYLQEYENAVVMVSHDRFFLDRTAKTVWELEGGKAVRYPGNYSEFRQEKRKRMAIGQKAWEQQQKEIARLKEVIRRFQHKPTKASFVRAKKKQIERMEQVKPPSREDPGIFVGKISPKTAGGRLVFEAEHLKLGYDRAILELSLRIRRGQKIGILGSNGVGKSTFLKTAAGILPALGGKMSLGHNVSVGYFDQNSAEIDSEKSVLEHFTDHFPVLTQKEARGILGSYLFAGKEAAKKVCNLSGGEKARLVLAELLQAGHNFLILDEPTNHMDIPAKETLEAAFQAYEGTILFVSHDRYFIRQVAESILIFENGKAYYHPFGYEHYLERVKRLRQEGGKALAPGALKGKEELSCRISAEDQALIESLRSVPKGERRRLRENLEEEIYEDWQMKPVRERMVKAGEDYEQKAMQALELLRQWKESEEFWKESGDENKEYLSSRADRGEEQKESPGSQSMEAYERAAAKAEAAWEEWHESCLKWYEGFMPFL